MTTKERIAALQERADRLSARANRKRGQRGYHEALGQAREARHALMRAEQDG